MPSAIDATAHDATKATFTVRVAAVQRVADDVIELALQGHDDQTLPSWEPGAHIEVHLPSGLSRHYSLCGDPTDTTTYRIAVLREPNSRGGSREIHDLATAGVVLTIGAPRNDFALVTGASYLFIGGGIGITPLLPMAAEVQRRNASWKLIYGGRTPTSMAYCDRLREFGDRVDYWVEAERGYPDLHAILAGVPAGTVVYTCGPGSMIDAVSAEFLNHPHLGTLHFERFSASGPVDTRGDAFEVELRRTAVTFTVPEGRTILQEVRAVLPDHPYSCEEGYCGECETPVLDGTPDHRDDYLTEDEQQTCDRMMICVSRCVGSRLVLDL